MINEFIIDTIQERDYGEMDAAYESVFDFAMEAADHVISKEVREKLPDNNFGIPSERKYPLIVPGDAAKTEELLSKAISMFHFCKPQYKKELGANIIKAMRSTHSKIKISPKSMINRYTEVPSDLLKEDKESA